MANDAAAKKRSEAAKKAAATRKANEEAAKAEADAAAQPGTNPDQGNEDPPDQEQPAPTDQEQFDAQQAEAAQVQEGSRISPRDQWGGRRPLQNAGLDQQAAHDAREAERAAQREEHNARTAKGVLETQRGRKVG